MIRNPVEVGVGRVGAQQGYIDAFKILALSQEVDLISTHLNPEAFILYGGAPEWLNESIDLCSTYLRHYPNLLRWFCQAARHPKAERLSRRHGQSAQRRAWLSSGLMKAQPTRSAGSSVTMTFWRSSDNSNGDRSRKDIACGLAVKTRVLPLTAEGRGLWPGMNTPSFGRNVVLQGEAGAKGFACRLHGRIGIAAWIRHLQGLRSSSWPNLFQGPTVECF